MKTEGGKPNDWSKDYPLEINPTNPPQDESYKLEDKPTRLNFKDVVGSMAKQFKFNRGTYSGPLEPDILPDEETRQLKAYETKARSGSEGTEGRDVNPT